MLSTFHGVNAAMPGDGVSQIITVVSQLGAGSKIGGYSTKPSAEGLMGDVVAWRQNTVCRNKPLAEKLRI